MPSDMPSGSDPQTPIPQRGAAPWMKWLLAGSLALNLAVLGLAAGAMWRAHGWSGPSHGVRHGGYARPYIAALGHDARRDLLGQMRGRRGAMPAPQEMQAQYAAVLAALTAQPFAPDTLKRALADQAQAAQQFEQDAHAAFLQMVLDMSPAARADYAARLGRIMAHGRRPFRRQDGSG